MDFEFKVLYMVLGASLGLQWGMYIWRDTTKLEKNIQTGFAVPSRLEIKLEDRDNNGKKETILKYGGKPYLLKEVDGKPIIKEYEIKSSTK